MESDLSDHQKMINEAMHFTVGRICEEVGVQLDVTFSKEVIATIADITNTQLKTYSEDLSAFARHAKRSTISSDDVKLLVRRNNKLSEHIAARAEETDGEEKKKTQKRKKSVDSTVSGEDKRERAERKDEEEIQTIEDSD